MSIAGLLALDPSRISCIAFLAWVVTLRSNQIKVLFRVVLCDHSSSLPLQTGPLGLWFFLWVIHSMHVQFCFEICDNRVGPIDSFAAILSSAASRQQ